MSHGLLPIGGTDQPMGDRRTTALNTFHTAGALLMAATPVLAVGVAFA